jgi:hypothetical protein
MAAVVISGGMKVKTLCRLLIAALTPLAVHGAIIGVSGPLSSNGVGPQIIPAPATVFDNDNTVEGMVGFNEAQGVTLLINQAFDGGGFIPAGSVVSSHMIFLDPPTGVGIAHPTVEWIFDAPILGVMSDFNGFLEASSSFDLGAPGTLYFGPGSPPFQGRGFEPNDTYTIIGNTLLIQLASQDPGDWVRVVTEFAPVQDIPEPSAFWLLASGLIGLGLLRRRS